MICGMVCKIHFSRNFLISATYLFTLKQYTRGDQIVMAHDGSGFAVRLHDVRNRLIRCKLVGEDRNLMGPACS